VQINFGNLTLVNGIQLTVPSSFAPVLTVQLGYSWDGISFAMDPTQYPVNGSSSYVLPLAFPLLVGYLRVYLIDVVQPSDLLTKTSGFVLNITGLVNSTNVTIASKIIILIELIEKLYIYIFPPKMFVLVYPVHFHHGQYLLRLLHKQVLRMQMIFTFVMKQQQGKLKN
jgi:hypothetical protein